MVFFRIEIRVFNQQSVIEERFKPLRRREADETDLFTVKALLGPGGGKGLLNCVSSGARERRLFREVWPRLFKG